MNDKMIYVKSFPAPEIKRSEVLRYTGTSEASDEINKLIDECITEAEKVLNYKVCYRVFDIKIIESAVDLGFSRTSSRSLSKMLYGSSKILVFCATVGAGIDRLIAKYSVTSPAKTVVLQALGSERIETLCDMFCDEIRRGAEKQGNTITRRFSPGYGDLPIELQKDIFAALECSKMIGVSLGDNLFMTPTKSVTAILGIEM